MGLTHGDNVLVHRDSGTWDPAVLAFESVSMVYLCYGRDVQPFQRHDVDLVLPGLDYGCENGPLSLLAMPASVTQPASTPFEIPAPVTGSDLTATHTGNHRNDTYDAETDAVDGNRTNDTFANNAESPPTFADTDAIPPHPVLGETDIRLLELKSTEPSVYDEYLDYASVFHARPHEPTLTELLKLLDEVLATEVSPKADSRCREFGNASRKEFGGYWKKTFSRKCWSQSRNAIRSIS